MNRRLGISLGKHVTVFQAEEYAILACVQETDPQDLSQKYISICSDSQEALKALQAAKTASPLVHQCKRQLNDISVRRAVRLFLVPGHAGVRGDEMAGWFARGDSAQRFVCPEHFLGASMQKMRCKITHWLGMQHFTLWCGPCIAQRQARESISGPELAKRARLFSFNRAQSRAVIGLVTGHNTLGRHLHILGMSDKPICRNCTEEKTSAHILCECEALALLRHTHLGSFSLDPADVTELSKGAIWCFGKGTGLL